MNTILMTYHQRRMAEELSQKTLARYRTAMGHYKNTPHSHYIGRLGEMAFSQWLTNHNVAHLDRFLDPWQDADADVEITEPFLKVEVKTWSAEFWPHLGRCIAHSQAKSVERKADVVAWMVVGYADAVTFAGWNVVSEVLALPVICTGPKGIPNHQMPLARVRPAGAFASKVRLPDPQEGMLETLEGAQL